jgi:hypothetical protein
MDPIFTTVFQHCHKFRPDQYRIKYNLILVVLFLNEQIFNRESMFTGHSAPVSHLLKA